MEVEEVAGGVFELKLELPQPYERVNVYLLKRGDGSFSLIDAGPFTEGCLAQLKEALEALGLRLEALTSIFLTHYHVDHAGLAGALQRLTGCEVFVHPEDLGRLVDPAGAMVERLGEVLGELDGETRGRVEELARASVERLRKHYSSVDPKPLGPSVGLRVVEAPGHTRGSVVYVSGGLGFCGDTVLDTLTLAIEDLAAYLATLDRLEALGLTTLYPGHGSALRPASRWIEALKRKYLGRVESVREIIARPKTLVEVARGLYGESVRWDSAKSMWGNPVLAILQTKTYLTYLVERGLAERREVGGLTLYASIH